tara:strand:- start:1020 stop:1442 length:423 start_codon:yes stop_codon:yes gene_type:complete
MKFNNILIKIPMVVLGLHAIINIFRGSIHFFLPEGGSIIIAGLDIGNGDQKQIIITIFAIMGAGQIIWGALQFYILFYAKQMIAVVLAFTTILAGMGVSVLYIFKPLPIMVPGHNNIYLLAVLIIATLLAYRDQSMKDYL